MSVRTAARQEETEKKEYPAYDSKGYLFVGFEDEINSLLSFDWSRYNRTWHLDAIDTGLHQDWRDQKREEESKREEEIKFAFKVTSWLSGLFETAKDSVECAGDALQQSWVAINEDWEALCVEALKHADAKPRTSREWNIAYLNFMYSDADLNSGFVIDAERPGWPESSKQPRYDGSKRLRPKIPQYGRSGVLDFGLRLY